MAVTAPVKLESVETAAAVPLEQFERLPAQLCPDRRKA
jgi:hypothetical protein